MSIKVCYCQWKFYGFLLAGMHLIISWIVIINICRSEPDAQWQLIWVYFFPFDFPFSILSFFSGAFFSDDYVNIKLPCRVCGFTDFIVPAIVHGVIGPLWYFFTVTDKCIPKTIQMVEMKLTRAKSATATTPAATWPASPTP